MVIPRFIKTLLVSIGMRRKRSLLPPPMPQEKHKDNFFTRLVKEDNALSAINFFLIITLAVGIFLLVIPGAGLIVDIIFNHTITVNMSDLGTYVLAVASIFTAGGLTSAWTEYSYSRYNVPVITDTPEDQECIDEEEEQNDDVAD